MNENGSPIWLKDGSFLWFSERSGFKHLYHYKTDGTLVRQVTDRPLGRPHALRRGREQRGVVYFAAGERSAHRHRHLPHQARRHRHDAAVASRRHAPRDLQSRRSRSTSTSGATSTTPTQVRLHRADGTEVRVIDANPVKTLAAVPARRSRSSSQVTARDGFVMDAMMIKPPDFNPSRRYPVFQFTYAGPGRRSGAQPVGRTRRTCFTSCSRSTASIVWMLDNRSAGGKGAESQWPVYGKLGELELRISRTASTWLKQQPYVDASRIAAARLELRRVHDGVRADAQHELGGRHRRRAGDRLAQLRHGLHRAAT